MPKGSQGQKLLKALLGGLLFGAVAFAMAFLIHPTLTAIFQSSMPHYLKEGIATAITIAAVFVIVSVAGRFISAGFLDDSLPGLLVTYKWPCVRWLL